jgi:phytoene dehydrogenase-like protein
MEKFTSNTQGAITGWAFSNDPMPAESRLPKILEAIKTPVPGVYQAGQWTYSPSGLPISILTGKLAADRVIKDLAKRK